MTSARTDASLVETPEGTVIEIRARNALVSGLIVPAGLFCSLGPIALAAYAATVPDIAALTAGVGAAAAIWWLTWRFGWRPRTFRIVFRADRLEVGPVRFDYREIVDVGLSREGGAAYDPASMPIPRNHTQGLHLYVVAGGRSVPITVGLKKAQAEEVLRLVRRTLDRYRATSTEPAGPSDRDTVSSGADPAPTPTPGSDRPGGS